MQFGTKEEADAGIATDNPEEEDELLDLQYEDKRRIATVEQWRSEREISNKMTQDYRRWYMSFGRDQAFRNWCGSAYC